jgi:penicillin amidase
MCTEEASKTTMENTETALDGLICDVEILVDTWGVPHIYAQNHDDLFFAQGFNAARDRLFQIDLWRRRGLGLLSEVFGIEFLERDRAARLFLYRGDMQTEWRAYGKRTKSVVTAFIRGINAYITWAAEDSERLPPEFGLYGYEPALWSPEDVPRIRSHGLFYNAGEELSRSLTLRDHGLVAERLRQTREPADELIFPEGLDLQRLSDEVLRVYNLGRSTVVMSDATDGATVGESSGSNNWVISGRRTATGRPILANDPHRAVSLPSLRYIAHLNAPGIDVIGGGEPALPGISIGHNGQVAFGLTIWPADQEDLYVYETRAEDPLSYFYEGQWERMLVVEERIIDSAGAVHERALHFTRHGPVIYDDAEHRVAVVLRAAWLESGMAPYLSSLEYLQAENAEQFVDALKHWGAPPVNQVYADSSGTIGWKNAGLVPIRPNWDGSMPVPGDGRYEWNGFYDSDQLPGLQNPEAGWIATANQMNLPKGYPNHERTITYDWYPSNRYERIMSVLASGAQQSISDSVNLQNDVVNIVALEIAKIVASVEAEQIVETELLRSIQSWSGEESVDSATALVFQVWARRHLRPMLFARSLRQGGSSDGEIAAAMGRILRDESFKPDLRAEMSLLRSFNLEDPGHREDLTRIVDDSLVAAAEELEGMLGADRSEWRWGRVHGSEIRHTMFDSRSDVPAAWKGVGPAPKGGSGDTVGMAAYDKTFNMTLGSTFRVVIDVVDWDGSVAMNSPGQSGDPRSTHYSDLFEPWLAAEAFPLNYSRQAVESDTQRRILLRAVHTIGEED